MSISTASVRTGRSLLRHAPLLAAALAVISVLLLGFAPLGWRLGWWHYRFALLSLLPWAAYFGVAALIVAVLALCLGRSRIEWRGVAIAVAAFAAGGLAAYVPWHYDAMRHRSADQRHHDRHRRSAGLWRGDPRTHGRGRQYNRLSRSEIRRPTEASLPRHHPSRG